MLLPCFISVVTVENICSQNQHAKCRTPMGRMPGVFPGFSSIYTHNSSEDYAVLAVEACSFDLFIRLHSTAIWRSACLHLRLESNISKAWLQGRGCQADFDVSCRVSTKSEIVSEASIRLLLPHRINGCDFFQIHLYSHPTAIVKLIVRSELQSC